MEYLNLSTAHFARYTADFWSENFDSRSGQQLALTSVPQFLANFRLTMGQKTSCLSSESKPAAYKIENRENRTFKTEVDQRTAPARFTHISSDGRWNNDVLHNKLAKSGVIKTRTTESEYDEENHADKKSGYILVDLKGDKVVHIDRDYLVGCEVRRFLDQQYEGLH